ncbi:DNA-binding transcriptional regulator, LysR family [Enhydrobacter aerosaccus]|uniref:DNA-binding transcriptional regulator, LysR family n=1 Tax=Enhydrobacter aerosaccus TaxID=225324 RepID=A0A1T4K9Y3_9HYPH|nr:LysR family transcriptional regulator [Enhydrobacter aerosaccus]SJZ39147.1 DNA-binding transcriptional regulator, LysR family [Enhydrobacter aerosaccus]
MDLRRLRQFVAVAEERSFRRAAERLNVSQPPLSVAVQRLEADMGVTLLDRTRHHVRLTVAGEAFLREARRTLAHAQLSVEVAQRAAVGKLGTLRLSFVPSAALDVVPRLLRAFHADYPDVKLMPSGETTSQQLAALLGETTDVGIVVPPLHDAKDLRVENLCEQELMLAVPRTHAISNQRRVQLRDLSGEAFVGFSFKEGPGFESVVVAACQDSGFIPNFVQVAPQMQTVLALVASGMGIALVPQAMQSVQMENVAYVQVRRGIVPVKYALGIAFRPSNDNPALGAFVALAHRLRRELNRAPLPRGRSPGAKR